MLVSIIVVVLGVDRSTSLLFHERDRPVLEALLAGLSEAEKEKLKKAYGDDFLAAFDCSNFRPADREPGVNCLDGLIADEEQPSPVPDRALWLLPVWQKAAKKYKIPWELLAAVAGARTNFGLINCQRKDGQGFYRFEPSLWERYVTEAGHAKVTGQGRCRKAFPPAKMTTPIEIGQAQKPAAPEPSASRAQDPDQEPAVDNSPRPTPDYYDAVDATFTEARQLAELGAGGQEKWKYSGSEAGGCSASPIDGRVFYVPEVGAAGDGARLGYNGKLDIPRDLVRLAARYRSDSGEWAPAVVPNAKRMPPKDALKLLRGALRAFKVPPDEIERAVMLNTKQISRESGFAPAVIQGVIPGDPNNAWPNRARGLFQFVPSTFAGWKVSGYDDIFNPLDNILAAVNAQVNSLHYWLDGSSGWGPNGGVNPYANGGSSTSASSSPRPLSGKSLTFSGKGSVFNDHVTASGISALHNAGLAVRLPGKDYNSGQPYLRGYWLVKAPNGRKGVFQQIDIGPHQWTGRNVDLSTKAALALRLHVDPNNLDNNDFTDKIFTVTYLSKDKKAALEMADQAGTSSGGAYEGRPQKDPISRAVRDNGRSGYSSCYVALVHDWYEAIKNNPPTSAGLSLAGANPSAAALLKNKRVHLLHVEEINDLKSGRISPRLIALLSGVSRQYEISTFALASDHNPGTNHEPGRAADIAIVDQEVCNSFQHGQAGKCWELAQKLDRIKGCLHPTELIYYWDPGPSPDSFAKSDHDDHIHVGYDGPTGSPLHYSANIDPCSDKALTGD